MKIYELDKTHIKIICERDIQNIVTNNSIYTKLLEIKLLIDKYEKKWNKYKKFCNEYEYVYSKYDIYMNICNILPISRSYFKLHEMIYDFNIFDFKIVNDLNICCIAEGPGGFLQCLVDYTKTRDINIKNIYGITLLSDDKDVPSWNPKIERDKNINLLYGKDNTGDICNRENIIDIIEQITIKCDLITCDGGIDYSDNYNSQEINSYEFIYNEIFLSLQIQKEGGTLIIKMFDIIYYSSIQLLYLLYNCYETISIFKPHTSRNTNSEKYIICKNYKYNKNVIDFFKENYNNKLKLIYIPKTFLDDIKFYNQVYIENQISNITIVIDLIKSNNIISKPSKFQIDKAVEWCNTYNLDINKNCSHLKTF